MITTMTGRLEVSDAGQGELPVVFVHSLAGHRSHWDAQLEHLSPRRRVVALDLRGHGDSTPAADGDYSVESLAADVEAVVDSLGIDHHVLVGHSMGGAVIAACAGRRPGRVQGLFLVDPVGDSRQIPERAFREFTSQLRSGEYEAAVGVFWGAILGGSLPKVRERVMQDLLRTPREVVIGIYEALHRFDILKPLRGFDSPMVTLTTQYNVMPYSLHQVVKGLPRIHMEGVSHWPQMDRPKEFNRLLDEFLSRVDVGGERGIRSNRHED